MAKKGKTWLPARTRPKKLSISDDLKAQVDAKARKLVETVLKPMFRCVSLNECLDAIENDPWFQP